MKRTVGLYLFLASILFSLLACQQTQQFTGTPVREDLSDVQVKLRDGEFYSVYTPGSSRFIMPTVSSKQSTATVKIVVGDADVNVKIKGKQVRPIGDSLEFVRKLNLKTGVNIIPILLYREDESAGDKFEIEIERKVAEGALRLTHLKCLYKDYANKDMETDDFVDELPFSGVYERQIATNGNVLLEVGSPELDVQLVEVNGVPIDPVTSTPPSSIYKTYEVKLKTSEATPVDITVYDTNKGKDESFHLLLSPLSEEQKQCTDIESVFLTLEDGEIFDFEKLNISDLKPYRKGEYKGDPVTIEGVFKCRELLGAGIHGIKPKLTVNVKEPGARAEMLAFWEDNDHANLSDEPGWNDRIESKNYDNFPASPLPVVIGQDSDKEFSFVPYNQRKFDFLFKVTSPDGTKAKYYEVKYNFPFAGALIFSVAPFEAVVRKGNGTVVKPVVAKASNDDEGLFNVYVPIDTQSVKLIADDTWSVNFATGYSKNYKDIKDYRFYLSVDDGPFSRTHLPNKADGNYKEIFLNSSSSGVEEHKLSIVSYQDGMLAKNGKFVDEYGKESGVSKVQSDFKFRFIKENRETAPSLSVFKVEGTQDTATTSAVQGKIWPTISFRPSVHEYKLPLVESGVTYKFKMLKTDSEAKIFIDGKEVNTTEPFTQQVKSVSSKYPTTIDSSDNEVINFFSYELKRDDTKYYDSGKLKPCTITITVEKGNSHREYSIEIEPVNPDENDLTINVLDSNFGSYRTSGVEIYYKEHKLDKELTLTGDGKLYKSDFIFLGTTGFDGKISGKGELKAGRYYDIYALGDDKILADSMIEHYYVSGAEGEVLNIVQPDLIQNGGADYKAGAPVRGSCPVRLRRQVKVAGTPPSTPTQYRDGVYFFFRQREGSSGGLGGGIGGGLGGGGGGSFKLSPVNLTCGDAHIKMIDSSLSGSGTDFITWFDVSSGNSVEPVAWGPDGVMIAFDSVPTQYSFHINMTDYKPNGQISMNDNAVDQQDRMKWNYPSGVYDLIIVAYDVAGNRLERHQLVSIEHSKMMQGNPIGDENDKDERRLKIEGFRVMAFRWSGKANIFEHKDHFERLFGMPIVEYTPPTGQGNKITEASTCVAIARGYLGDAFGPLNIHACDLYRRCVEDGTPFKKVGSTVPNMPLPAFGVMDSDFSLEEGKTYQYKMVLVVDEGYSVETECLAEMKILPSFMYFLDSIKVRGQGANVEDGAVYKYNANKKDTSIPLLKKKKYPSGTPDKDKEQIRIDYRARLSSSVLWNKEHADQVGFGIIVSTRDANVVFASKCAVVFNDEGDEDLLIFVPAAGRYIPLSTLIERGFVKSSVSMSDLITFDKKTCMLTIKDSYLRIPIINSATLFFGNAPTFNYEAGETYYWDIVSYDRYPFGGHVSAMEFTKYFDAKKKDAPSEKYLDEDGDVVNAGLCFSAGNSQFNGNNAINGKCRFTVVEE